MEVVDYQPHIDVKEMQCFNFENSEFFFLVFNSSKKRNCLSISALASKKWSNQKDKSTLFMLNSPPIDIRMTSLEQLSLVVN